MYKKMVITLLFSTSAVVHAGAIVGATEFTQIANNLQLVAQYAEEAQQTATQIQQYTTMLKNLKQMTPSHLLDSAAQQLFTDQNMYGAFKNLQKTVIAGQQIAYTGANLEQQFKNSHPGYSNGYAGAVDFVARYKNVSDGTLASVKNALGLVTSHSERFGQEQSMLSELQLKSQTAEGQLQVLQAGNQIGLASINQMQQLRQLQMAQTQQQSAYIAGQQTEKDTRNIAYDKLYGNIKGPRLK